MRAFALLSVLACAPFLGAAQFKVGTINARLLFKPGIDHPGKVDEQKPMSGEQYAAKVANLAKLASGLEIVGWQEVGGEAELRDLASTLGHEYAFVRGTDTYTGQNVGVSYKLPKGWRKVHQLRTKAMAGLSKHLVVEFTNDEETVIVCVVHLIRPIGKQNDKHEAQLAAVTGWLAQPAVRQRAVLLVGDTNNRTKAPIFEGLREVGELNHYAATHLDGSPYDRMGTFPPATFSQSEIVRPPYGKRPNDANKNAWTDHFVLKATWTTK